MALLFTLVPAASAEAAVTTDAASLKQLFDRVDDKSKWDWYMNQSPDQGHIAFGEAFVMKAYVLMYEATKDKRYLDDFIKVADSVLDRRDSVRGVKDYRGLSLPAWRTNKFSSEYKIYALHTGLIVTPMAQFASVVKKDSNLASYGSKANVYLQAAKDGIAVHYGDNIRYPDNNSTWIEDSNKMYLERPINMSLGLGSAMLAVYEATGDKTYLDKGTKIANFLKGYLKVNSSVNGYVWGYYPNDARNRFTNTMEDTNHTIYDMEFVNLAYRNGIFSSADMQMFANTGSKLMVKSGGTIADAVDGSGTYDHPAEFANWLWFEPWAPSLFDVSYNLLEARNSISPKELAGAAMLNYAYARKNGSAPEPNPEPEPEPTPNPAGNIVVNGDFSAGTTGWINLNNSGTVQTASDGNKYLANSYNFDLIQELNPAPGVYKLNARSMSGSSGSGARILIQYRDASGNKTTPYNFEYSNSGSGWEAMPEMTLDVPSSAAVVRIYLLNASKSGSHYFDNVTLVPAGGTPTPPAPAPDTEAPTVDVTAPSSGSDLKGTVNLDSRAADNVGVSSLSFAYAANPNGTWTHIGDAQLATDAAKDGTWRLAWDITNINSGTYYVRATAVDAAGNKSISEPVAYKLNSISNNMLTNGDFSADTTGWINLNNSGTVRTGSDGNKYLSNSYNFDLIQELNPAPGVYKLNASSMRGSSGSGARILIQYRDASGKKTTPYDFEYSNSGSDWEAMPEMTLNVPSSAAVVRIYLLNASKSGTHYFDDVSLVPAGGTSTPPPAPAPDTESPTTTVTAPSSGSDLKDTVTLESSASDNLGVSSLAFAYAANPNSNWVDVGDAQLAAGAAKEGTWRLAWDVTNISSGTYYVRATAVDAAGNKSVSEPVPYELNPDTDSPTAAVTAPSSGSDLKGTVNLDSRAVDNVGVSSLAVAYAANPNGTWTHVGDAQLAAGTAKEGTWRLAWDVTNINSGTYYVRATAVDAAGNKSISEPVAYKVNPVTAPVNMISNGDFSAGTAGWTNLNNAGTIRTASDGNKYLANSYNFDVFQEFSPASGEYKLNIKTMQGSANTGARVVIQFRDAGGNKTVPYDLEYTNRGSGWEAMPETTVQVPTGVKVMRIYLLAGSGTTGTQYFDDVTLLPAK